MASIGTFSGGGLGMGVAFRLEDEFSGAARDIERSMSQLEGVTDAAMGRISRAMAQVKVGAVAMGAGLAIAAPFAFGVKLAADAEQLEIAYGTILKSDAKAKQLLAEMNKFADLTPYDPAQVQDAGKSLLAMGTDAKSVIPVLTQLGDIASGLNIPLKDLADIYGKNLVQGFLDTQDVKQMAGRGIPIFKALQDAFKKQGKIVSMSDILDLAPKRAITADIFKDAIASLSQEGGQFSGLMERQSKSAAGLWSTAQGYIENVGRALGRAILPQLKEFTTVFIDMLGAVAKFVDTPLGASFIKAAVAVSLLLIALGSALIVAGLWNVATGFMVKGLLELGLTEVATALATEGLTAGFVALAGAVWTALAPLLPFIAVGAVIAGIIYGLYASIQRFNDVLNGSAAPAKGFLGLMQRIGGILSAAWEIWNSWDSATGFFTMTEEMETALKKIGVLDFVLGLSTWLVRIKAFFDGVAMGAKEVWGVVTWAWGAMKTMISATLDGLSDSLKQMGITVGKLGGDWKTYLGLGRIVGWGLIIIFVALAAILILVGVVAVVALMAIFIAILIVVGAVYLVYKVVQGLFWVFQKLGEYVIWVWTSIYDAIVWVFDFLVELPGKALEAGRGFVNALKDGIFSGWASFISWITGKVAEIPLVGAIKHFFSDDTVEQGSVAPSNTGADLVGQNASMAGARAAANAPAIFDNSSRTTESINLYNIVDTDVITSKVMDKQQQAATRE